MGSVSVLLLLLLAFNISYQSWAQFGCTTVLISLSPCLNYITGSSSTPSSSCCSRLSSVVQSQPQCLCSALNGGASLGVTINQTRALALPGACDVQTPPPSRCNNGGGGTGGSAPIISPVSDPADEEPAETPTDTSEEGDFPAAASSQRIPTSTIGGIPSRGTKMQMPFGFYLINVFVVVAVKDLLCSVN